MGGRTGADLGEEEMKEERDTRGVSSAHQPFHKDPFLLPIQSPTITPSEETAFRIPLERQTICGRHSGREARALGGSTPRSPPLSSFQSPRRLPSPPLPLVG